MRNQILFVLICASCMLSLEIFSQSLWKLKKNKEGIKVFTRTENNSDFKSFKATTIVNASIEKTLKVFKKTEDYPKWYGYTKTSKLLKQENDVQYNYVETIFPWPFKNRDMVYEMTTRYLDANVVKTTLKGIPNYIQEKKGIVRMVKAEGYILLESSSNKTKITYVFHSEPGDNIPAWMANNSIAKLPFKTMLGLRKTLEKNNE